MEITINQVQEIVSALTADEQQLLKDTINYGSWGDSDWEFLNDRGCVETVAMYGYCTNDAKRADISAEEKYLQCSALCIRNYAQQTTIR